MKICAISTGFASWAGGPEIALHYLSQYWTKQGHEVYILCGSGPRNGPNGIKVIKLPFLSRRYFDRIPGIDRVLFFLPTFELESFTLLPFLLPYLKKINPHVVLTVTLPETIAPLMLGYPTVMISQAGTWYRFKLYEKADMIIVNEPLSLMRLRRLGFKVKYILNGTEIKESSAESLEKLRIRYNIPDDGIKILTVARLDKQKRIHLLIEAFKLLEKKATLIVVGEGPELARLKEKSTFTRNKVIFLGNVPHEEVLMLNEICDVFSLPSFREACPLSMIEALCLGKSIVTNPEPRKIFLLGDYGTFVDVENPREYASALLKATLKKIDRNSLEFRKHINQFLWEKIAQEYIVMFKHVLEDKRNAWAK